MPPVLRAPCRLPPTVGGRARHRRASSYFTVSGATLETALPPAVGGARHRRARSYFTVSEATLESAPPGLVTCTATAAVEAEGTVTLTFNCEALTTVT